MREYFDLWILFSDIASLPLLSISYDHLQKKCMNKLTASIAPFFASLLLLRALLDYVGAIDILVLEDFGPESSQLMAVADLNDMELLDDTTVKSKLFLPELGHDGLTQIQAQDVEQLFLRLEISFEAFELVLHFSDIVGVFE